MRFLRIFAAWLLLCGPVLAQAQLGAGQVWGNPTAARAPAIGTATPLLGTAGSVQGTLRLSGVTSGTATITAQAAAGTPTITLPNASGTVAVSATAPIVLSATTGALTCPTCVTGSGGALAVGTTAISVGATSRILFDNGGVLGEIATANSGVLVTSAGGAPSISSTLPSGIAATSMNLTTPTLGVASGTSLALGGAAIGTNALGVTGNTALTGTLLVTNNIANAFQVGFGNTIFQIDNSVSSAAAGLKMTAAVTGGTVALAVTDTGANANVTLNAKGTGTIGIGSVSTGAVTITPTLSGTAANFSGAVSALSSTAAMSADNNTGFTLTGGGNGRLTIGTDASGNVLFRTVNTVDLRLGTAATWLTITNAGVTTLAGATTISSALTYGGVTLNNAVTGTGNMVLSSAPVLAAPQLGVATATSVNKVAITAPATSATLTIADGTTLTETTSTSVGKGQYLGTSTNDNATAGNIGEYISSSIPAGSAVSLTSGSAANITSISLTAGDWDVSGLFDTSSGATADITQLVGWTSLTSATLPTPPNNGAFTALNYPSASHVGFNDHFPIGTARYSLSAPTTIFLSVRATFTISTVSAYGFIGARRAR